MNINIPYTLPTRNATLIHFYAPTLANIQCERKLTGIILDETYTLPKTCTLQTKEMQIHAIKTHTTTFTPYEYMDGLSKITMNVSNYAIPEITQTKLHKIKHLDTILGMSPYHYTIGYPIYITIAMAILIIVPAVIYVKWRNTQNGKEIRNILCQQDVNGEAQCSALNTRLPVPCAIYPDLSDESIEV